MATPLDSVERGVVTPLDLMERGVATPRDSVGRGVVSPLVLLGRGVVGLLDSVGVWSSDFSRVQWVERVLNSHERCSGMWVMMRLIKMPVGCLQSETA